MPTPFPFQDGNILFGSQLNDITILPTSTQTGNYTLQASDKGSREIINMASAGTVTVPNGVFEAGAAVWVHSIGSGTITLAAGTGMTLNSSAGTAPTLAQWEGGVVYFSSSSSAIFFRGGSTSTLSIEYLLVAGGGGGGGSRSGLSAGGGGGGGMMTATDLIAKGNTYTVTVGAGGAAGQGADRPVRIGNNGTPSSFIRATMGGGAGTGVGTDINPQMNGLNGGSGGGGCSGSATSSGGAGISGQGNNGGGGSASGGGGAGGGAGGTGGNASGGTGGTGGTGSANTYTGSSITYAAGGAGGSSSGGAGSAGTTNRGNGGSGCGGGAGDANGGAGGSGRVVLRALTTDLSRFTVTTTGSPTTGTDGSYTFYAYDSTGTFRID